MVCGEAEDAGGLTPVNGENEATHHFVREVLAPFQYSGTIDSSLFESINFCLPLTRAP